MHSPLFRSFDNLSVTFSSLEEEGLGANREWVAQAMAELENALSIERSHRTAAEQVADAERHRAQTAEMALRMLEHAPSPHTSASPMTVAAPLEVSEARSLEALLQNLTRHIFQWQATWSVAQ